MMEEYKLSIAMEDVLRMSNSDDIDFLKWMGRKS